jgi:hypothetical protein
MFKLHKINPMVRAIGTMGAVAALAGGITFANLNTNTVALSPNTLDSADSSLQIGLTNGTSCDDANAGPRTGLTFTGASALVPGVTTAPFDFCLVNTGAIPVTVTTGIPQSVFASSVIPPSDVTLTLKCGANTPVSGTLDQFTGGSILGTLAASGSDGAELDCNATVQLASSYAGNGGQGNEAVAPFAIDFVGNQ